MWQYQSKLVYLYYGPTVCLLYTFGGSPVNTFVNAFMNGSRTKVRMCSAGFCGYFAIIYVGRVIGLFILFVCLSRSMQLLLAHAGKEQICINHTIQSCHSIVHFDLTTRPQFAQLTHFYGKIEKSEFLSFIFIFNPLFRVDLMKILNG